MFDSSRQQRDVMRRRSSIDWGRSWKMLMNSSYLILQRLDETEIDRDRLLAELEEQDKQVPEWEWIILYLFFFLPLWLSSIFCSVSENSSVWLIGSSGLAAQPVNLFFLSTQPYIFLSQPGAAQYCEPWEFSLALLLPSTTCLDLLRGSPCFTLKQEYASLSL